MSSDGLVGLVDIFAKNTKRWAIKRWAGLAGPAILKKYEMPVDGLAGLAGWAGLAGKVNVVFIFIKDKIIMLRPRIKHH